MAYDRKIWECNETISAEALNNIEDGIEEALSGGGGSPLVVHSAWDEDREQYVMDTTFGEIRQAVDNGRQVLLVRESLYEDEEYPEYTKDTSFVLGVDYNLQGGLNPSVSGNVRTDKEEFSVAVIGGPYTLEALDAQYPFSD